MSASSRKLAAVLAADVAGYSRLMGEDETGTLAALREFRRNIFEPSVTSHHGRTVKSMGDGWFVEFASVVDAVNCALAVQEQIPSDGAFKLRSGIHAGDIVHEDEDIFGDGVNVAARLQALAEPGGILLSDVAHRSIDATLGAKFRDLGSFSLKNIRTSMNVYGWNSDASAAAQADSPTGNAKLQHDLKISGLLTLLIAPGILVLGLFLGFQYEGALVPLIGAAALTGCVGIALLVAARIMKRSDHSPGAQE